MERGRPRGATDPARTLRRIQSALRPWHHLRTENRRQCGFHPVVDAAGSEMAVMQDEAKVEYVQMKDSLSFYAERYLEIETLPPEKRPIASLELLEKKSMKKAFDGLRQAINDCVEMSFHLDHAEVERL